MNELSAITIVSGQPMDIGQHISTVYGPYAFGVTSLLVLWYFIVRPELREQRASATQLTAAASANSASATALKATAESLERTAGELVRVVDRLELMQHSTPQARRHMPHHPPAHAPGDNQ